jgi:peptidoglycan hydrolase-like protein with peptidoglycan-binding domain
VNLDGRTIQRGLVVLGFDPGRIDGIVGERTLAAFDAFVDHIAAPESTIRIADDERSAEILPNDLAVKLDEAAARYVDPSRTPASRTPLAPDTSSALVPARFWRASNPWAWGAALVPTALLLGALGVFFLSRKR